MNRSGSIHALSAVALLALWACGDGTTAFSVDHSGGAVASVTQQPLIEAMVHAPSSVLFSGVRRVELHVELDGIPTTTMHREQVHSDGQGKFSVELTETLVPIMPPEQFELFQLLQSARAGFIYRLRDFRIRDLDLFLQNYAFQVMPGTLTVAGHECLDVRVERLEEADRRYLLAVEPNTGMILRSREESLLGELISQVEYESIAFDPDQAGVSFHVDNHEIPLDLDDPSRSGIHYSLQVPGFLPQGFQLRSSESAEDASDHRRWGKLTFGDGVEQVFFLHGGPAHQGNAGNVGAHVQGYGQDTVGVFHVGPWTIAQGELAGQRVLAMGKCPEHELLLMLESAIY